MKKKIKLLLYCPKGRVGLYDNRKKITGALENFFLDKFGYDKPPLLNGKIAGECDFEVEEIESFIEDEEYIDFEYGYYKCGYRTNKEDFDDLMQHSHLTAKQLDDYLKGENSYAIRIKNLNVFDKPRELKDYYKRLSSKEYYTKIDELGYRPKEWLNVPVIISEYFAVYRILEPLKNAPKNMMYICEYDHSTSILDYYKTNILIPVHPELLCKILNGECSIIIKKRVLKEMLKNDK